MINLYIFYTIDINGFELEDAKTTTRVSYKLNKINSNPLF